MLYLLYRNEVKQNLLYEHLQLNTQRPETRHNYYPIYLLWVSLTYKLKSKIKYLILLF